METLNSDQSVVYSKIYGLNFDVNVNGNDIPVTLSTMCFWGYSSNLTKSAIRNILNNAADVLDAKLNLEEEWQERLPTQVDINNIFMDAVDIFAFSAQVAFESGWNPCDSIEGQRGIWGNGNC